MDRSVTARLWWPGQASARQRARGHGGARPSMSGRARPAVPARVSGCGGSGLGAELLEQRSTDLEEVADDEHVGELRDGCIRVAVDRDDRGRGLHPDLVLDRARDAHRQVELWLRNLARLADLRGVRDPARIDRGAGRPYRATEP